MSDILADVKAALARVDEPEFEPEHSTHAYAVAYDDDGNDESVCITWDQIRALVERCESLEAERDTLRLATQSGCLDEMHLIATRNLPVVEAERNALRQRCEAAEVALAQFQDFVRRERALRDGIAKGGQHCNGDAPSINPSVLRELERMLRDAPDVAKRYADFEHKAEVREEAAFRAGYGEGSDDEHNGRGSETEAWVAYKARTR